MHKTQQPNPLTSSHMQLDYTNIIHTKDKEHVFFRVSIPKLTLYIRAEREAENAEPAFIMLAQPFVMNLKVKRRVAVD